MNFPSHAPLAYAQFWRSYCRRTKEGKRENWKETCDRTISGLARLGLASDEADLVYEMQYQLKAFTSGRWLWVGGTEWIEKPENFSGAYNCSSTNITDWKAFGLMMDLAMTGCGTGAVLEEKHISQLPPIRNRLNLEITGEIGKTPAPLRLSKTRIYQAWTENPYIVNIRVGDSRQGWVESYQALLEIASDPQYGGNDVYVVVDLDDIRPAGTPLKGFGGIANPIKLPQMYSLVAAILNQAIGRQLTSVECCLLIDEAALTVVAGNIRRSAGIRQASSEDVLFSAAKDNLWEQGEDSKWRIDPKRDALRMANHTRVFHQKPTLEECIEAVRKQYCSGEGAIMWAGEAVARANADLLDTPEKKGSFLEVYSYDREMAEIELTSLMPGARSREEIDHRMQRYGLNPCGEILGSNFHCNLSEVPLNQINPLNYQEQEEAFTAAALSVSALLKHKFVEERYQQSRELDPIVGVSFTGLFDFFVDRFGIDWLKWWEAGRPRKWGIQDRTTRYYLSDFFRAKEMDYLIFWRKVVEETVWDYCDRHGLKCPNRCTTVQPSGSKSLLTNASPGWHPPKAQRFIRRMTFERESPIALALRDYGYTIIPSPDDKDENGQLLDDPFDPRCQTWLVEFPVAVLWADLPGADEIKIENFSALAQFDFYMVVQKYYTRHNTSATIELQENEIEPIATRIHQSIINDEGYISTTLLARFNAPFPRLPFEKINKATYEHLRAKVIARRKSDDLAALLALYDNGVENGPEDSACSGSQCEARSIIKEAI